ncbi:hypothetical protein [[Kitasatospora] papulosa]|uniref:hypothetical protein n=1 Tax=[Kitasatospora] papulosa TaxID=1464011 RepID=UPI00369148D1
MPSTTGTALARPSLSLPAPAVPPPPVPALTDTSSPPAPAALQSDGIASSGRGAMVLAIGTAVAALRGMTGWLNDRRQRFQDMAPVRQAAAKAKAEKVKNRAEHEAALAQIGGDAEKARAKGRVQALTDGSRGGSKGSGSGGSSGGKGGGAGGGRGTKSGSTGTGSTGQGKGSSGKNVSAGSGKPSTGSGSVGSGGGKSGAGGKGSSGKSGPTGGSKNGSSTGSTGQGKGKDGSGKGLKSPGGGKSPSSSASSPSMERARGRQERAAARLGAKSQRKADRQAARLDDRAKHQDADRARKNGSRDSEQAVKDKIRNRRLKDKAKRKDKARKKREKDAAGRTTFGQAVAEGAQKRLENRRKNLSSPVLSRAKKKAPATPPPGPKVSLTKAPKNPPTASAPASTAGPTTTPPVPGPTKPKVPPPGPTPPAPGPTAPPTQPPGPPRPGPTSPQGAKKRPKFQFRKNKQGQPPPGPTGSRPGSRSRSNRQQQPPPRQQPHTDGEWLRPPPGMSAKYTVTLTRLDREEPPKRAPGAITRGRPGLPAGAPKTSTSTAPTSSVPGQRKGARPMGGAPAVQDTQFVDADLTVYDVIESDEDMAEEILAGAEHAKLVADRCERLVSSLESLHAELSAKFVPGVLIGWCARLIERAGVVETKAEELAAGLPRASEAIAHAGQVAADYDKHPADVTRDMGHTAPADASYHQE